MVNGYTTIVSDVPVVVTKNYPTWCAGGKFLIQGVKINTPHYLAKMEGIVKGTSTYTVIVSQLESLSTIYYTLRVSVKLCF